MDIAQREKGEKMLRLIDADKLAKDINGLSTHPLNEWDTMGILMQIDKQPTVDAEPVRHGHWDDDHKGFYKCSVCGEAWSHWWRVVVPIDRMNKEFKYCPSCGARMDLEE